MAIVNYNPWSEIDSLERQINRMFNGVLAPAASAGSNYSKYPAAEITETKEALVLKLEVPGMQPQDIEIEATAKSVLVKGDRQFSAAEEGAKTRSEFRYGSFERVVPLPVRIQNTEVKAQYKDGVLHLTLPKAEAEKNKVVKVSLLGESDS